MRSGAFSIPVRVQLILWNVIILAFVLLAAGAGLRYRLEVYLQGNLDQHIAHPPLRAMMIPLRENNFAPDGVGPPQGRPDPMNGNPDNPPPFDAPPPNDRVNGRPSPHGGDGFGNTPLPGNGDFNSRMTPLRRQLPNPQGPEGKRPEDAPDVHIYDLNGQVLDPNRPAEPLDNAAFQKAVLGSITYTTVKKDGIRYRVFYRAIHNPQNTVVMESIGSMASIDRQLDDLTHTLLTLIPLAMLATAIASAFLAGRSMMPMQYIVRTVSEIQASDLGKRLPVKGHDEFARLADTINGMLNRLQTAFENQRRFTMDASHELKTPLTVIKAKTSLALHKPRTAEAYRETLTLIDEAVDRMSNIVQDLLLLARSDNGEIKKNRKRVDLRLIIEDALREVVVPENMKIVLPQNEIIVMGTEVELTRIFKNLIENAVRHTPCDGEINITAELKPHSTIVTVKDNGEGIAPDHLPNIGNRFYRADSSRSRESGGTGLGLAICSSIMKSHGGSLSIDSTLGAGTSVKLTFPAGII